MADEAELKAKRLAARKRLRDEFDFYAAKVLLIRTKSGEIKHLILNKAQAILHEAVEAQLRLKGLIRVIILKARQQGLSTYVGGRMYFDVSQRRGAKALVLAHTADSTRALFDMVRRYHDNAPDIVRPSTKYSSKRELKFDKLDSAYVVATAGGDSVARGETFTHVHASEMAFWPKSSARTIWNGLEQAVAEVRGTEVYIESTANGVSGLFYDMWQGAVKGENGFVPVFIPWFIEDLYTVANPEDGFSLEVPEGFTRGAEEELLAARALRDWGVTITDTQLHWRRMKISRTSADQFKQEYPATADEAFLTSGRPVFNPEQLHELLELAPDPNECPRFALEGKEWKRHSRGELVCYSPVDPSQLYVIGADVGGGVPGGDYSVAQVLDRNKRQVAVWRGRVLPDYFADILLQLAERYNHARLAVESNNHGVLTNYRLSKEFFYDNLYQNVIVDKVTDQETTTVGFATNVKTRPMVLDQLRADTRDAIIVLRDKATIREMQTFIVNEAGKMEAEEGSHDDCVLSLAIANYAHDGIPQPIDMDDDYYVDRDLY